MFEHIEQVFQWALSWLVTGVTTALGYATRLSLVLPRELPVKTLVLGCVVLALVWWTIRHIREVVSVVSKRLSRRRAAHNYRADNSIVDLDGVLPAEDGELGAGNTFDGGGVNQGLGAPLLAIERPVSNGRRPAPPGARLAKRCGMEVRARLGYPSRTKANKVLAVQRCAAWLEEHAPDLRKCYYQACLANAVLFALAPSKAEVRLARLLNDPEVADREHYCNHVHTIPMFQGVIGEWLSICPWFRIPSASDF